MVIWAPVFGSWVNAGKLLSLSGPQLSHFKKEAQIKSDVCRIENRKVPCTCHPRLQWEVTLLPQGQGWEPDPELEDGIAGADQETGNSRVGAANKGDIWSRRTFFFC